MVIQLAFSIVSKRTSLKVCSQSLAIFCQLSPNGFCAKTFVFHFVLMIIAGESFKLTFEYTATAAEMKISLAVEPALAHTHTL